MSLQLVFGRWTLITCSTQEPPFQYVTKQCTAAIKTVSGTNHIEKLSLNVAVKLFKLKITSVFTYELDLIWMHNWNIT
jgi:hypothetical protein